MNKKVRFQVDSFFPVTKIDVEIETWKDSKGEVSGCFEFYDLKTNGEDIYAEGGLWFEEDQGGLILSDYDGVFEIPKFILQKLHDEFDVNVEEHLDI